MKTYEKIARYFLGFWFSICAIDGWAYLLFDLHLTGEPQGLFFSSLVETTYFWAFLKIVQTIGAISMLANYKPALGLVLLAPVSAVLCLFYIFELTDFIPFAVLIIASTFILGRAYSQSYVQLLKGYP